MSTVQEDSAYIFFPTWYLERTLIISNFEYDSVKLHSLRVTLVKALASIFRICFVRRA